MATFTTHGVDRDTDVKAENTTEERIENDNDLDPLSPTDAAAIVGIARELLLAASKGQTYATLKGKQLGLMCSNEPQGDVAKIDPDNGDADLFRLAASRLGAQVARIRPRLTASSSAPELHRLALMLGRLYDAVECQGMSLDLVKKIRAQAGVPVYFWLASVSHPTAVLVDQLEVSASPRDKRLFILQAALLRSLGGVT
jgi:ornithine carbamoyltransferase